MFNETVAFPDPGSVMIPGIPAGARCTVRSAPMSLFEPEGYVWDWDIGGNPATIVSGATVTVAVTNRLTLDQWQPLMIEKGVSIDADGPFIDELNVLTGTMVYYRITVSNQGEVPLTGVSVIDSEFDLAECGIPSTLGADGASYECNYSDVADKGTLVNTVTADSLQTMPVDDDATVIASDTPSPRIAIEKSPDYLTVPVMPGYGVDWQINVVNTGNVALHNIVITDDKFDLTGTPCRAVPDLDPGEEFGCDYYGDVQSGTLVNTAMVDSDETGPESNSGTVTGWSLTLDKSCNAPLGVLDLPTVKEGDTVTFTLSYTLTAGSAGSVRIADFLPDGLTFLSATGNDEFGPGGYEGIEDVAGLVWGADTVTKSGSLTYMARVDEGAADLKQPLTNYAAVYPYSFEDDTLDSAECVVYVLPGVRGETSVPAAPQTDTVGTVESSVAASGIQPIVLVMAGVTLAIAFFAPTPASGRRRGHR